MHILALASAIAQVAAQFGAVIGAIERVSRGVPDSALCGLVAVWSLGFRRLGCQVGSVMVPLPTIVA
jgi:hypothetical protein